MTVANKSAMTARGLDVTPPQRYPLLQWGHHCWGIEKGRALRALPPFWGCPRFGSKGDGAQGGSITPRGSHIHHLHPDVVSGMWAHIPPLLAYRTVRGLG